jgi:hypothetical protein
VMFLLLATGERSEEQNGKRQDTSSAAKIADMAKSG